MIPRRSKLLLMFAVGEQGVLPWDLPFSHGEEIQIVVVNEESSTISVAADLKWGDKPIGEDRQISLHPGEKGVVLTFLADRAESPLELEIFTVSLPLTADSPLKMETKTILVE